MVYDSPLDFSYTGTPLPSRPTLERERSVTFSIWSLRLKCPWYSILFATFHGVGSRDIGLGDSSDPLRGIIRLGVPDVGASACRACVTYRTIFALKVGNQTGEEEKSHLQSL